MSLCPPSSFSLSMSSSRGCTVLKAFPVSPRVSRRPNVFLFCFISGSLVRDEDPLLVFPQQAHVLAVPMRNAFLVHKDLVHHLGRRLLPRHGVVSVLRSPKTCWNEATVCSATSLKPEMYFASAYSGEASPLFLRPEASTVLYRLARYRKSLGAPRPCSQDAAGVASARVHVRYTRAILTLPTVEPPNPAASL